MPTPQAPTNKTDTSETEDCESCVSSRLMYANVSALLLQGGDAALHVLRFFNIGGGLYNAISTNALPEHALHWSTTVVCDVLSERALQTRPASDPPPADSGSWLENRLSDASTSRHRLDQYASW